MQLAGQIIAMIAGLAGLAGAVIAGFQARAARRDRTDSETAKDEARAARDEARELAREANDAFLRQAAAQERANDIAESQLPKDHVVWDLQHVDGSQWCVINVGSVTAADANLLALGGPESLIRHEIASPRDVRVGASLDFIAISAWGSNDPAVRVHWHEPDGSLQTEDFTIRKSG